MNLTEAVIEGTIQPDGSLVLDEPTKLPPGRVQVVMQLLTKPTPGTWGLVEVMDEIRANQLSRGYHGRTLESLLVEERARTEEEADYDRRWEQLWGGPLPPSTSKE